MSFIMKTLVHSAGNNPPLVQQSFTQKGPLPQTPIATYYLDDRLTDDKIEEISVWIESLLPSTWNPDDANSFFCTHVLSTIDSIIGFLTRRGMRAVKPKR